MAKIIFTYFKLCMKVNNVNSLSFQSRNQTIRFADDIARRVNVCFPRVSSSIFEDFNNANKYRNLMSRLFDRINIMREYKLDLVYSAKSTISKIGALICPIRMYNCGNCRESAQLGAIAAKINGIKNCYLASIHTSDGTSLDHGVVYVDDKKPYIIDTWLGFADYVPNAIIRYKSEYLHHFDAENNTKIKFNKKDGSYDYFLNKEFEQADLEKLRKYLSELVLKKTKS